MRIGAICEWRVNTHYRHLIPLAALEQRGHEVVRATRGLDSKRAVSRPELLRGCDVVLAYRLLDAAQSRGTLSAVNRGAAFVWDTDDDLSALPRESPHYRENGGVNARRIFAATVHLARAADVVTSSTPALAERYRSEGIERIEPIDNHLANDALERPRRHDGLVIGWTAGLEHAAELSRIQIVEALRRLLDARPELRVESLGLDLGLPPDRYTCLPEVPFERLQRYAAGWDVAIAPLSDIPFNRTRSSVKVKEYASAGTPWLASPVGPYAALGEGCGGELVAHADWHDALDRLLDDRRARKRLSKQGRAWAKTQTIEHAVGQWEAVLVEAVERRRARPR